MGSLTRIQAPGKSTARFLAGAARPEVLGSAAVSDHRYGVAVVGCGEVGARRAASAAAHPWSELRVAVDPDIVRAQAVTARYGGEAVTAWSDALARDDVDVVVVATPHLFLAEVAVAALKADKHVLVETPMARNVNEAVQIAGVATRAQRVLKVGFNHRYHPGVARAHGMARGGVIGDLIQLRARYGHAGRPGAEATWRGNRELAGGGMLTDLGIQLVDLVQWFAGEPEEVFAWTQSAARPGAGLEDGAFALLRWPEGLVAQLQTSWTELRPHFSLEVVGKEGCITAEGLGGGFGAPSLTVVRRRLDGRLFTERTTFDEDDASWTDEWAELMRAVDEGAPMGGTASDGVTAISLLDAMYRSANAGQVTNP